VAVSFDTVRHDLLVGKVARRVQDAEILHLLKLMLKASGKRGSSGRGDFSPPHNIYLTEADAMIHDAPFGVKCR
jgi:RNA-directed DNA polymerase